MIPKIWRLWNSQDASPRYTTRYMTQNASTPAAPTVPAVQVISHDTHRGFFGWIRKVGEFLLWILSGFGLLGAIFGRKSSRTKSEEVIVYCVHRSFFLWLLILVGFVSAAFVNYETMAAGVCGWIYVVTLLLTFTTLLFDVNSLKFLLWTGIFAFIWILSKYLEELKHIPVLSSLFLYLKNLNPKLDPGFAKMMSWLLLGPWLGSLFLSFCRGRKTFSPNSIEEWYLGEGCEITDRNGLKFHSRYRDLFETLLGLGAGDLEAVDSNGNVVKRWENVLFLMFSWRKLDEILHQRAAMVDNATTDPVEVEDVNKKK